MALGYQWLGIRLCELAGIDPSKVSRIQLDCPVDDVATATITTILVKPADTTTLGAEDRVFSTSVEHVEQRFQLVPLEDAEAAPAAEDG